MDGLKKQYNELVSKLPMDKCGRVKAWTMAGPTATVSSCNGGIPSSKGCYIATCVYGSYNCPQVRTLRRFRDYTLDETWYRKLFIKCYYAISPSLVKWFGETRWLKWFWKKRLDSMVNKLKEKDIKDTCYNDRY